ncbi:MAG: argininosuccinate lyase [Dehalococcoidia bacterium]
MKEKRWAGRFERPTDPEIERFTASVAIDKELWREDIDASIAHAEMLAAQGIIPAKDGAEIVSGLTTVAKEIAAGDFNWRDELEDVHGNIEGRLVELIGPEVAGRLHTARSRNDQVVTDLRLWLKRRLPELEGSIRGLQQAMIEQAEGHIETLVPGYTHLQRAQPVSLAHHLLAHFEMLERDRARLRDALTRLDELPLGSGALAGVPYPVDREAVADALGFSRVSANSIDAVSDRDFVVEVEAAAAVCMMHLSRLAEEIVLWTSSEFAFARLDDAYATGSSIMPQKKNPDVAELIRGRTGVVYGHLMSSLTMLKGLPLSYNRDLQEDKAGLFATVATLESSLAAMTGLLSTLTFDSERMGAAAADASLLATDLADHLARKGLPFAEAHAVVGKLVRLAENRGGSLVDLSLEDLQGASPLFTADALRLTAKHSVEARTSEGGTAFERVHEALARARKLVTDD